MSDRHQYEQFRTRILKGLIHELLGPEPDDDEVRQREILDVSPLQLYATGVLFPQKSVTEDGEDEGVRDVPNDPEAESADVTWLAFWSHWTAFHDRAAEDVEADEWHVHFSFPWTFADGGAGSDSCPIPAPQESDAAALSVASSGELPAFALTAPSPVSESIVFDAGRASLPDVLRGREGGGFLKSYSPAAPLCILTGVVLC